MHTGVGWCGQCTRMCWEKVVCAEGVCVCVSINTAVWRHGGQRGVPGARDMPRAHQHICRSNAEHRQEGAQAHNSSSSGMNLAMAVRVAGPLSEMDVGPRL
jgi:hypothetical protein